MTVPSDDISDFLDVPSRSKKPGRRFRLLPVLALVGIIGLLAALLLPANRSARPAGMRMQCQNNLKQIALALHNYESTYKVLPPAHTVDAVGRPLHSWRTLILPFLDQKPLYDAIDLSKPWNDPANAQVFKTTISAYVCPGANLRSGHTSYLAVAAAGGCFLADQPRYFSEITDDHGRTLMVLEADADHAVHWMAPVDADLSVVMGISPDSKLNHPGGMNAALVDGSVHFLHANLAPARRRSLVSISGNDDAASALE